MPHQRTVAMVLFDGVEVLDFAGPFEVFSLAGAGPSLPGPFNVFTVAERRSVTAGSGLVVVPTYRFDEAPQPDILVVPGGNISRPDGTHVGRRHEMHNPVMLAYVQRVFAAAELTISVCTGAMILAMAGLVEGLRITTHHGCYQELRDLVPSATVVEGVKMVDTGRLITSGGISAGIDMSLAVVQRLLGERVARQTAEEMEYDWAPPAERSAA
jgi:transcriptional regulator GlxA family with amidase domain